MKFKEGYKVRSMAGENVVIMQGTAGSDMTRIISLNDSSLLLWNESYRNLQFLALLPQFRPPSSVPCIPL